MCEPVAKILPGWRKNRAVLRTSIAAPRLLDKCVKDRYVHHVAEPLLIECARDDFFHDFIGTGVDFLHA